MISKLTHIIIVYLRLHPRRLGTKIVITALIGESDAKQVSKSFCYCNEHSFRLNNLTIILELTYQIQMI